MKTLCEINDQRSGCGKVTRPCPKRSEKSTNHSVFRIIVIFFLLSFSLLSSEGQSQKISNDDSYVIGLTNPQATPETKALFANLMKIQKENRLIFGQYRGTTDGRAKTGDIYDMTGHKPGLVEWHVPYFYEFGYDAKMAKLHEDYESGMLIGFFWRMYNPITGGEADDTSDGEGGTIDINTLLPGGIHHQKYLEQLDMFVKIAEDLPKINGRSIPVFMRFLPEMSQGNSRWYKRAFCSPAQYRQLWLVAQDYLVKTHGLNNILWQFNPNYSVDTTSNRWGWKEYYPGHDLVDICGNNIGSADYLMEPSSVDPLKNAIKVASEAGKLVAIAQMNSYLNNGGGVYESIPDWWTDVWLSRLKQEDLLNKIAFSSAWRNEGDGGTYFLPYKGHEHESNFVEMCAMPEIMLAPDVPDLYEDVTVFTLYYSELSSYSVDLNWLAPDDSSLITSYIIFQNGEPVDTIEGSGLTLHIRGLESMSAYVFTVKAIDNSGKISAVSNTLILKTPLPVGPQLNLTYSNLNHNSVTLKWEAEGDDNWVFGYIVYQEDIPVDTLVASVYSSSISGLKSNTSYNFTVEAIDSSGNTIAVSNTQELTTLIPVGPELSLEYSNISDTSLDINWFASGDLSVVAGYIILQDGLPIDTVDASVFTLSITGLESETTYYFTVKAIDASGNIISLTEISSVTTISFIETTLNLTYSNITSSSVDLSWEISGDQSEITKYIMYRDNAELDTLDTSVLNTTIDRLEGETSYDFFVKAEDAQNEIIAVSNTVTVTTIISSSEYWVDDQSDELVIYPNPTTGKVYLKNADNGMISIASMAGKIVYIQEYFPGQGMDVSVLEPGLYILELAGNTKLHLLLRKE